MLVLLQKNKRRETGVEGKREEEKEQEALQSSGKGHLRPEGKLWLLETWTVSRPPCVHLSQQRFALAHRGPSLQERPSRLQHVGLKESKVTEGQPGLFTVALTRPQSCPAMFPGSMEAEQATTGPSRKAPAGGSAGEHPSGSPQGNLTQNAPRKAGPPREARLVKIEPRGCSLQ